MKTRVLAALVVACLAALFVTGCGDDSEGGSGGDSTKELASTPGSGDSGSDTGSDSGSDSGSGSSDGSEMTLPDMDDLEDLADGSIPDFDEFGDLGDCMSQATAYASLAMSALGGDDSGKSAEKALKEMKATLPKDLHDDLDVLADAYKKVAKDGFIEGGEAMDTPEFQQADEAISAYFEETCGGGG
jgi:hypothetical protein